MTLTIMITIRLLICIHPVYFVDRMDAAMERERLLALEKEKAKDEAKKRYM